MAEIDTLLGAQTLQEQVTAFVRAFGLTPQGQQAATRLDAARIEKFRDLFTAIPEDERAHVLDVLVTLTRALNGAVGSEDARSAS